MSDAAYITEVLAVLAWLFSPVFFLFLGFSKLKFLQIVVYGGMGVWLASVFVVLFAPAFL